MAILTFSNINIICGGYKGLFVILVFSLLHFGQISIQREVWYIRPGVWRTGLPTRSLGGELR